jgi:phospholipase C
MAVHLANPKMHVITQSANGLYEVWRLDPEHEDRWLTRVTKGHAPKLAAGTKLTTVGGYVLAYTPPSEIPADGKAYIDFTLLHFDPSLPHPLAGPVQQSGGFSWFKFAGGYSFQAEPNGKQLTDLTLLGVTGYVLSLIPTPGRMTFGLWNFDAAVDSPGGSLDPLPSSVSNDDAFPWIEDGDELFPFGNEVLVVHRRSGSWTRYSFDPQQSNPLSYPALGTGKVSFSADTRLAVLGDQLVAWVPGKATCTLYPLGSANPFRQGRRREFPKSFPKDVVAMTAIMDKVPVDKKRAKTPGTMDFLRERVKHVVVYVLESRSFDSVLGWLHEKGSEGVNWVGATAKPPFRGASPRNVNTDSKGVKYPQGKVADGKTGPKVTLNSPTIDPFHNNTDAIRQHWSGGFAAYEAGDPADMNGFVRNNGSGQVMAAFTPDQLRVLNGLAKSYAVSDMWFSSEAGVTTSNRASLASGSSHEITATVEGGNAYKYFSKTPHRQSMWKVLANNGIIDWSIFYSVLWEDEPYTYNLFLKGELPSVDKSWQRYVQPIRSFHQLASRGELPAFSFLEPVWIAPSGLFTSYHPGGNVLPGEQGLRDIYESLRNSPAWNETLLVVTFSKGGGNYDHVPAQRMKRAWPNDGVEGYGFDVTGTRVPAIVISPLVESNTVFRSDDPKTPYDATSIAATVLSWFGIPKLKWGLGERVAAAPTFEGVVRRKNPRKDTPKLVRATDSTYPTHDPIPIAAPTAVPATWSEKPKNSAFTDKGNWVKGELPTSKATFGPSARRKVRFAYNDPQQVDEIHFAKNAGSYELLFDDSTPITPALTLAGKGVTNASGKPQLFRVAATSLTTTDVQLAFVNEACAGDESIAYETAPATPKSQSGGIIAFLQRARAGSAKFKVSTGALPPGPYSTVGSEVRFLDRSSADQAQFTILGSTGSDSDTFGNVVFYDEATASKAQFTNIGGTVGDGGNTQFFANSSAARCSIVNLGATGKNGNGGDTAFDGRATAAKATITNYAAKEGHGGVTSFNNNPPRMAQRYGATAGKAKIKNFGAEAGQSGSGGHTEFTGVYGSGDAGEAHIENFGSSTSNSKGGGYTLFCNTGEWPYYQPTAANAQIDNYPGTREGSEAGYTHFIYQNYKTKTGEDSPGPLGGYSVIRNHGGAHPKAPGGYTLFANRARAKHATLIAFGGTRGGLAGAVEFADYAEGNEATVQLIGGILDVSASKLASLTLSKLLLEGSAAAKPTLVFAIGPKSASVHVMDTLSLPKKGKVLVKFGKGKPISRTHQVLLRAVKLTQADVHRFHAEPVQGLTPRFEVKDNELLVMFS